MLTDEEIEQLCVGMQMGKTFQDKTHQLELKWLLENDILLPRDRLRALKIYNGERECPSSTYTHTHLPSPETNP